MARRAIVIFPELNQFDSIQEFRQLYDPLAALIRPHITLVFPFESAISPEELSGHVSSVTQQIHPFTLCLRGVTGHTNEYLFLNVKRGNDQVIDLHDQLYTGVLAPYFSVKETYFPHLTIGRVGNGSTWIEALRRSESLTASIEIDVHEVSVYRIELDGNRQVESSGYLSEV